MFVWIALFAPLLQDAWWAQSLVIIAALSLILACLDPGSRFKSLFSRHDIPLWIFLFTMAGGLVNIVDRAPAWHQFWSFIFPIPFIYYFTKLAFREESGVSMLRGICFVSLIVCVLGIIEFAAKRSFIYERFFNNFCYSIFKGARMMSTQVHPAPLGTYMAAVFPLAVVLALKEKRLFLKLSAIITAAAILICAILTFSRGALLGVLMAGLTMSFFLFKRKNIFFILVSVLSAVVIVIGISSILYHYHYSAFGRFSLQGLSSSIIYSRKIERIAPLWDILRDHPLFGLGFGHYRILFEHYMPDIANIVHETRVPDCAYMLVLAETGLLGFSGFALFIYFLFKRTLIRLRSFSTPDDGLLLLGFLAGFISILCAFLTYDGLYWIAPAYLLWSYTGMLSSLSGDL